MVCVKDGDPGAEQAELSSAWPRTMVDRKACGEVEQGGVGCQLWEEAC